MKKYLLICIIGILILGITCNLRPILNGASEIFWDFVCQQLDKEEAERQQRIANGELVRGKDTILIWGNMYEIGHFSSGNHLTLEGQDVSGIILGDVQKHKRKNDRLFIIAKEGYAVIDENNLCKVFRIVTEEEIESDVFENEKIVYLSSYDEFSNKEQEIFQKLENKRY